MRSSIVGAHPKPRLDVGGGVEPGPAGGQVDHDEAGGPPVVGDPVQDEGELVAVDGAPPPRRASAQIWSASTRTRRMMV